MNTYGILSFLTFVINCSLACWILIKARQKMANIIFSAVLLTLGIWGLAGGIFSTIPVTAYKQAFMWWQIGYIGVISIPVFYCHFVISYLKINRKSFLIIAYGLTFFFILCNFLAPKLFLGDLKFVFNQFYWHDWNANKNMLFLVYYISIYWFLLAYSFFLIAKYFRGSLGITRNQLKYIIVGSVFGWLGGELHYFIDFGINIYPVGVFLTAFYTSFVAYAIIRHRLMDIEVIVRRAVVFAGLFGSVFAVFAGLTVYGQRLITQAFSVTNQWLMATIAVLIITIIYYPLRNYLTDITDRFLFQKKYDYQKILREASIGMAQITELRKLLSLIVHVVSSKLRSSQTSILLFSEDTNSYKLEISRGKDKITKHPILEQNNPLVTWLLENKEIVLADDINYKLENKRLLLRHYSLENKLKGVKSQMQELRATICVPAFIKEKLLGMLLLGEKLSRDLYSQTDLVLLSTLFNQASVAIEKVRIFDNLRQTREQLLNFEKLACVGQMASSVVHEIKNPLTVIKTFVEYLPKKYDDPAFRGKFHTIVKQEADKINKTVEQLLDLAKPRGLVMSLVNISELIDATLAALENELSKKEITVTRDYFPNQPDIQADKEYIQQVFFNLFLNSIAAIDAQVKEKPHILSIRTLFEKNYFVIEVSDTGCGISQENIDKLFTPFFTTKEKGTGLGLVISSEIVKNHGGNISVSSKLGEGTTFTITLPVVE